MAFKSVDAFNEERYHGKFRLPNDGDTAEVIFLYRSRADELQVNAHYINSAKYTGYVHCCGVGCPACAKNFRVQNKLFIPVYVLKQNGIPQDNIEFWDRQIKFDTQLEEAVFSNYPNPSEYVFRITRKGVSNDRDTRYFIQATNKNNFLAYDAILAKFNAQMPDYYSEIIREYSSSELAMLLQNSGSAVSDLPEYTPIPRAGYESSLPNTFVDASEAVNAPVDLPELDNELLSDEGATDTGNPANEEGLVGPEPEF